MEFILRQIHKAGVFGWLYVANLALGFHFFSVQFLNSSFLSTFIPEREVGLLFAVSAVLALIALSIVTLILARIGNYRTVLIASLLDLVAVLGLAFSHNPGILVVCFAAYSLLIPVMLFTLDVFLESGMTDEESTGNTRGIFLSLGTLAALLAPVLGGYIAGEEAQYQYVYLVSSLFLLPFIAILITKYQDFADPVYQVFSPVRTLVTVLRDGNVFHIAAAQFLMRFFFSWMVIYMPIYLHTTVGFSWPQIGVVLFIMLVPYILIEWPAGMLADGLFGEKELLVLGFVLTATATASLSFITAPSVMLWGSVLFVTRMGTALIESMTETYFFKHVDGDDIDMIGFFRMLRPLAFFLGPLVATLTLLVVSMQDLWLVLALIMTLGLVHTYKLVDTK